MNNKKTNLLYEGKAKRIFATELPDQVLVEFKDDATAFNALKHAEISGKGSLNCKISAILFEFLNKNGISTHYIELVSDTSMVAQSVEIIPLEVVIRNLATGSLCKQTPIKEGTEIVPPLLDLYYKDDLLGDPLLTDQRLKLLNLVSLEQKKEIEKIALNVNYLLKKFFQEVDLCLVDFKLEFGLNPLGNIVLADEISPDTCRLWDKQISDSKDRILDKDRFRQDLGGVIEAYREIYKRIQANP